MNSEAPPLSSYLLAGFPCLSFQSTEDDRVIDYIKSSCIEANEFSDSTPYAIFKWTCIDGIQISSDGLPPGSVLPDTIKIGGDTKDLRHAFITFKSVTRDTPTVGIFLNVRKYLDNPLVIQSLKDAATTLRKQGSHIILVGPLGDVPDELRAIVTELDFRLPDRDRLQVLYKDLVESYSGVLEVTGDINGRIKKAAEAAIGMTELEAENALALSMTESNDIDIQLIQQEKARAVKKSDVLEWFSAKEKMSDVGDFDNLKQWVEKRKNIFNDSAVEYGLPIPKGLLLLGIPGTGKSLVSKAIAGYLGLPLIRFDIGSLFKKYVGTSEESTRNALRTIEAISPVVVHFDELEKGFAGVNSGGDSGVGSRVLGTILTWMQERSTMSFIVATVNNVELLPAELYRAGRFDKVFATDLPGQQGREEIYRIHIKKRKRDPKKYDIRTVAAKSVGFVGAEIEYVVEEAMFDAFADNGREFTTQDLLTAIENVIPMSKRDREKIEVIRAFCKERATPVSAGEKKSVIQKSISSTRRVAAKKLIKKVRGGKQNGN